MSQKKIQTLKTQYEEKLSLLHNKIKETETERDHVGVINSLSFILMLVLGSSSVLFFRRRDVRGRSAGSFPEQRLAIEPKKCWLASSLPHLQSEWSFTQVHPGSPDVNVVISHLNDSLIFLKKGMKSNPLVRYGGWRFCQDNFSPYEQSFSWNSIDSLSCIPLDGETGLISGKTW